MKLCCMHPSYIMCKAVKTDSQQHILLKLYSYAPLIDPLRIVVAVLEGKSATSPPLHEQVHSLHVT